MDPGHQSTKVMNHSGQKLVAPCLSALTRNLFSPKLCFPWIVPELIDDNKGTFKSCPRMTSVLRMACLCCGNVTYVTWHISWMFEPHSRSMFCSVLLSSGGMHCKLQVLVTKSRRFPLMIDPQNQALKLLVSCAERTSQSRIWIDLDFGILIIPIVGTKSYCTYLYVVCVKIRLNSFQSS